MLLRLRCRRNRAERSSLLERRERLHALGSSEERVFNNFETLALGKCVRSSSGH